jgi:hypothetical protein
MKTGYNLVLTKLIDLMNNSLAKQTLVDELLLITNSDDKILRFIGGNEGTNLGYRKDISDFFIQFCKDAKVKEIYLRVEIDDFYAGLNYYIDLRNAGLVINYIDFGNEDYFEVKPRTTKEWLLWKIASTRKNVTVDYVKEYATKFLQFDEYCMNRGYYISSKLVWQTHFKIDAINETWHNELKSILGKLGYSKCTIHIYGELDKLYWINTEAAIKKNFKDLVITSSETHGLGFHNLKEELKADLRNSKTHEDMNLKLQMLLSNIGVVVNLKHTLFDWNRSVNNRPNYYAYLWLDIITGKILNRIKWQ